MKLKSQIDFTTTMVVLMFIGTAIMLFISWAGSALASMFINLIN